MYELYSFILVQGDVKMIKQVLDKCVSVLRMLAIFVV